MKIKNLSDSSFLGPKICAGLLGVLALAMFCPTTDTTKQANAQSNDIATIAASDSHIALSLEGAADQETQVTADKVAFRTNNFTVNYSLADEYYIYLSSMNGYGSSLFGRVNTRAEIKGIEGKKTPSQFAKNTWGYAIASGKSTDMTNVEYEAVPNYTTDTLKEIKHEDLKGTDKAGQASENSDPYTLAFAALIGSDSPSDHYETKVYLSVVSTPGRLYTINYDLNDMTDATGGPTGATKVVGGVDAANVQISSDAPKAPANKKKNFAGWSENKSFNTATDGTEGLYAAGSTIAMTGDKPTITLYAIWEDIKDLTGLTYMQDLDKDICEATAIGTSHQLTDKRAGNKKYWVTRLADGNCWMTQNLDFDGGGTQTQTIGNWDNGSGAGHVQNTTAAWYEPGDLYYVVANGGLGSSACGANAGPSGCGTSIFNTTGDAHYHIGNFYSWPAATTTSGGADQASDSICPAGWKLPTSGTSGSLNISNADGDGSFEYLLRHYNWAGSTSIQPSAIGSAGIYGAPLYFFSGGRLDNGQYLNGSTLGYYWSSTPSGSDNAYSLYFYSGYVSPSTDNARYGGMPVRCLVQGDKSKVPTS